MTQLHKAGETEWRQHLLGPNANGYARVGMAFRNGIAAIRERESELVSEEDREREGEIKCA